AATFAPVASNRVDARDRARSGARANAGGTKVVEHEIGGAFRRRGRLTADSGYEAKDTRSAPGALRQDPASAATPRWFTCIAPADCAVSPTNLPNSSRPPLACSGVESRSPTPNGAFGRGGRPVNPQVHVRSLVGEPLFIRTLAPILHISHRERGLTRRCVFSWRLRLHRVNFWKARVNALRGPAAERRPVRAGRRRSGESRSPRSHRSATQC